MKKCCAAMLLLAQAAQGSRPLSEVGPTPSERRSLGGAGGQVRGGASGQHFVDTAGWVGTAYTPARATNSLWWARFEDYEEDVRRELAAARRALALPTLRVYVHTLAFEAIGAARHAEYVERFLSITDANNISVGFVLFGDSWNHGPNLPQPGNTGANSSCVADGSECCPRQLDGSFGVKGCHNGCWFANPQDFQRGDPGIDFDDPGTTNASFIERNFRPFVEAVVTPHTSDPRVLWWEVFNEPCEWRHYNARICTRFQVISAQLIKESAYAWVKALSPSQPVISCWADHNNTFSDILDVHLYNSAFASWSEQVFSECPLDASSPDQCARGAVVTEAGARWSRGFMADNGSPLTVLNYLRALPSHGAGPFVPGVMLAWELMVGNANTRWSAGPPCVGPTASTVEPPIPWCGLLWPDGTPVSYTEAAAIRHYTASLKVPTTPSPFLLYEDFLPASASLEGDMFLNLTAGSEPFSRAFSVSGGGVMVEIAFWLGSEASIATWHLLLKGGTEAWEFSASTAGLAVARVNAAGVRSNVGWVNASSFESGVPLSSWNLMRVRVVSSDSSGTSMADSIPGSSDRVERVEIFLNPLAQPTVPDLGHVYPRTIVSAVATAESERVLVLLPPGSGHVLVDYVSALPQDGGLVDESAATIV